MAEDVNEVILVGRLVKDGTLKYTSSGMAISSFTIAVNRRTKKNETWEDEASFFDCSLFNKSAEAVNQYMTKGKQIAVSGSLRQDRWTDKDGSNRSKVVINAETVQLLGSTSAQAGHGGTQGAQVKDSHNNDNPTAQDDFTDTIPF